jgi:hypothetical protein
MTTYQSTAYRVRQLFSTLATATASNPVLLEGEKWNEKDATTGRATGRSKTGDGVVTGGGTTITGTAFNDLPFDPGGSGGGYVYQQSTPATTWTINHSLGYRPSVELLDSGSQEIDGAVSHPTVNQTVITLSPATAGLARLT